MRLCRPKRNADRQILGTLVKSNGLCNHRLNICRFFCNALQTVHLSQTPSYAVHISSIGCIFVLLTRYSTIIVNNPVYLRKIQSVVEYGGCFCGVQNASWKISTIHNWIGLIFSADTEYIVFIAYFPATCSTIGWTFVVTHSVSQTAYLSQPQYIRYILLV